MDELKFNFDSFEALSSSFDVLESLPVDSRCLVAAVSVSVRGSSGAFAVVSSEGHAFAKPFTGTREKGELEALALLLKQTNVPLVYFVAPGGALRHFTKGVLPVKLEPFASEVESVLGRNTKVEFSEVAGYSGPGGQDFADFFNQKARRLSRLSLRWNREIWGSDVLRERSVLKEGVYPVPRSHQFVRRGGSTVCTFGFRVKYWDRHPVAACDASVLRRRASGGWAWACSDGSFDSGSIHDLDRCIESNDLELLAFERLIASADSPLRVITDSSSVMFGLSKVLAGEEFESSEFSKDLWVSVRNIVNSGSFRVSWAKRETNSLHSFADRLSRERAKGNDDHTFSLACSNNALSLGQLSFLS